MINAVKDNIMILKESAKSRILHSYKSAKFPQADDLIKHLGLKNVDKVILGKPNTTIIMSKDMIVRMPQDKLSATRCRLQKEMLKKLRKTSIAYSVPRFFKEGRFKGQVYYCEQRLPGFAVDLPISKMDDLVLKAADFIAKFHKETSRDIVITETCFKRLFGRDLERLYPYLSDENKAKLEKIEKFLKEQLLGKSFKTVWMQGDYKIENILFNTKTWQIKGIIDWDLSRRQGLPLLDIFYLLSYKDALITKKTVTQVLKDRFFSMDFNALEQEIVDSYTQNLNIAPMLIKPMLIMFWLNHIAQRFQQQLMDNNQHWIEENLYQTIDSMLIPEKK